MSLVSLTYLLQYIHLGPPARNRLSPTPQSPLQWLVVLGAVFTDKIICQQLTSMIWIGHNRILNKAHTRYIARVLHSLGRNILKLKDHYNSLATSGSVQVNPLEINIRRFFPSINSYYDNIKQTQVYFDYVEPLKVDPACITFHARTKEGDKEGDIVVGHTTS